ncbi:ABC transporter permease [Paenibacillus sp. GYB006]|uniref:ABC transporter permease n=1 Tax=Paenibacillus sp. GYB006 TaxID=2994394 RepID=UPI003FA69C8F
MRLLFLVRNENMKLYNKTSTWVLLCTSFFSTFVVLLVYLLQNQQNQSLWNSISNLFQTENQILYLVLIVATSYIVNQEFSTGTAKLLFIRPFSRLQIILSKLISTLQFSFLLVIFSFISCILIGFLIAPYEPLTTHHGIQLGFVFQLKLISFLLYSTLFFALSLFIRNIYMYLLVGLMLMGTFQMLPSMIIFPDTGFVFSLICWIVFTFSIFIASLLYFRKTEI